MAPSRAPSLALLRSLRAMTGSPSTFIRPLSSTTISAQELESHSETPSPDSAIIANLQSKGQVSNNTDVESAATQGIGPRRRRMAMSQNSNIPFNELPYQCFQEARKILIEDRKEKIQMIEKQRNRIQILRNTDVADVKGGSRAKEMSLYSMEKRLEDLKIFADINDPNVKRRFEDGKGDMNKPIYRYLAEKKWREYRYKIQVQRIETMHIVPDVLPNCEPVVDIRLSFGHGTHSPGDYVESNISENPPRLRVQTFAKGERLFTVAVVDPDVPNLQTDSFDSRCHFLATNVSITPTSTHVDLSQIPPSQLLIPWIPPTAQKGSPYHRICIVLLQQKDRVPIDTEAARKRLKGPNNFSTRGFMHNHMLKPIGATLFRVKWDNHMSRVMNRHNIPGGDIELKRKRVEALPYQRRNPASFR